MIILVCSLMLLLGLKVLYNFGVPYHLLWLQNKEGGVSIMIHLEWLLLALALVVSAIGGPEANVLKFWSLLRIGAGAILASYVHCFLVMIIGGWIVSRKRR